MPDASDPVARLVTVLAMVSNDVNRSIDELLGVGDGTPGCGGASNDVVPPAVGVLLRGAVVLLSLCVAGGQMRALADADGLDAVLAHGLDSD